MSDKNNVSSSEEIDLGKLFILIGDGFNKIYKGFLNIFKTIFHYFIISLIFLKKNAIILGLATLIGVGVGVTIKLNTNAKYESNMNLNANFGSSKVLYTKIDYLNDLIKIKDTVKLSSLFNIPTSKSKTLLEFEIEPLNKEKQLLEAYDNFKTEKDTIITKEITFKQYIKRFDDYDFTNQNITAYAYEPEVLSKLTNGINKIVETDLLLAIHKKKLEALDIEELNIKSDLRKLDTLRKRYNKVALLEANKINSTASLNLVSSPQNTNTNNFDIDIYSKTDRLIKKLIKVRQNKVKYKNILSVITDFSVGFKSKDLVDKLWFKYGLIGFLLSLFTILGLRINKFLNNYSKIK